MFTPTFKTISGEKYKLNNIIPYLNGVEVSENNKVYAQMIKLDGNYNENLNYRKGKSGWCAGMQFRDLDLSVGEAVVINNTYSTPITLRVSGEVVLDAATNEIAPGYHLYGNLTPVPVTSSQITPYVDGVIVSENNKVYMQKIGTSGDYGENLNYRKSKGKWCAGMQDRVLEFAPGEAFSVNNTYSDKNIVLKFPNPISE